MFKKKQIFLILAILLCSLSHSAESPSISGIVKEALTDKPLLAAVVKLEKAEVYATTNFSGQYQLFSVKPGRYTITAELAGYEKAVIKNVKIEQNKNAQLDIKLNPIGPNIRRSICDTCEVLGMVIGRIFGKEKIHISGAAVTVVGSGISTTTDIDGIFNIMLQTNDTFSIAIIHNNYTPDTIHKVSVISNRATELQFELKPLNTEKEFVGYIKGKTIEHTTGSALINVQITLLNTGYKAVSDSDGAFYLETIAPGQYSLLATRWGFESFVYSGLVVTAGDTSTIDISLSKREVGAFSEGGTGIVMGKIHDAEGKVVADATVWVNNTSISSLTDESGGYKIVNVPAGVRKICAYAEGYDTVKTDEFDVWSDEITDINIVMTKVKSTQLGNEEYKMNIVGDGGTLSGMIADSRNSEGVAGVGIIVTSTVGRTVKGVSDLDGRYEVSGLRSGIYTVAIEHSGFEPVSQSVSITSGQITRADIVLNHSEIASLGKMSVRSVRVQSTGAALLKERQKEISFTDAIGAQEMSRGGAGNAAEAIKIVTGVTLEDNKYVIVRGMPKRYTLTMLNGSILPSPDPNTKAVNMDLFPSGMVDNITVYKTLTPNLPSDFSGGVVNIVTKPFPEKLDVTVSLSGGFASGSSFNEDFLSYNGGKLDLLAMDDGTRGIPSILEKYSKIEIDKIMSLANYDPESNYIAQRLANPNDRLSDTLALIDEFLNSLDHSDMSPKKIKAPLNSSFSASIGNSTQLFGNRFGYRISLNYANKYSHSDNGIKNDYEDAFVAYSPNLMPPVPVKELSEISSKHSVEWGVLGTAAYLLDNGGELSAEYIHIQNATDEVSVYKGKYPYFLTNAVIDTYVTMQMHYIERTVDYLHPTYKSKFKIGGRVFDATHQASLTRSTQSEPDLRDFQYNIEPRDTTIWYKIHSNYPDPSHKYRDLVEYAASYKPEFRTPFYQWSDDSATFSLGADISWKSREVRERRFEYRASAFTARGQNQFYAPTVFFVPESTGLIQDDNARNGYRWGILMRDLTEDISQWDGWQFFPSLYSMIEMPVGHQVTVTGGLKLEYTAMGGASINERFRAQTEVDLSALNILPSVSAVKLLDRNMNIRLAYGRTLAMPTLREIAGYPTSSFTGGKSFVGNRNLEISTIDNIDIRWEWYMKPGELLAVSPFFKRIQKPIEVLHFAEDYIQPNNAFNSAKIFGCEFEARKQLTERIQASGNLTVAHSMLELDPVQDKGMVKSSLYFPYEDNIRPFQGQSPLVLNIFLTYDNPEMGLNMNLVYNMFWERLAEITSPEVPWLWQDTKYMLNLTATKKLSSNLELKLRLTDLQNAFASGIMNTEDRYFHDYQGTNLKIYDEEPDWGISIGIGYSF